MPTDYDITTAMIVYGGSFVSGLGMLYRRADADNRAILKAAFGQVWTDYAALVPGQPDDKPTAPHCPRCGSYQWTYQGDRQVCADCGRE